MIDLVPEMHCVPPLDIIFGYVGFHSRNESLARTVADEEGVELYRLIIQVMRDGQANPDERLFRKAASELKK